MNIVVYWSLIYFIELTKLSMVIFKLLDFKIKYSIKPFLFGYLCVISSIILTLSLHLNETVLTYFISGVVVFTVIVSMNCKWKTLYVLLSYFGVCILDMFLCGLLIIIMKINLIDFYDNEGVELLGNSLSIPFLLVLIHLKKMFKFRTSNILTYIKPKYIIMVLIGIIGCGLYVAPVQVFGLTQHGDYIKNLVALGLSTSGIVFIIVIVALLYINDSKRHYQDLYQMNLKLVELQKQYYIALMEKEEDTKKFRHDINNHIVCLTYLCERKRYSQVLNYLKDMQMSIEELRINLETGNDIVNTIVYNNLVKHKENNIDIKWVGVLPENIIISSMDLCTIFSNLIINAIEGVIRIESDEIKIIETQIKRLGNNILINMKNPIANEVIITNNKPVTIKANKELHGFGSLNIEECVRKYNGSIKYECANKIFSVEIIFHNILKEN